MKKDKAKTKMDIAALKTMSVLYVEDDKEIQRQLSLFLKPKVRTLYSALDGREGLEIFNKHKPDVIITDIRMPTMGGLKMAKSIREIDQDIPIIVITAFNEQEYFLKSIDIGIDKYVLKPIDPYLLLEALIKSAIVLVQKREIELNAKYIRFILDANPSFIITTNKNELEYINKTFLNFLGYHSLEDFKKDSKSLEDFFLKVDGIPLPLQKKRGWLKYMVNNPGKDVLVYFVNQKYPAGEPKIFLVNCNRFPEMDNYIFSFTDITKIETEKKEFKKQAATDALTGVSNRNKLLDILHAEINRSLRYQTPLSLIMFDIDYFKRINDAYGHNIGDCVLKQVTQIVSDNIRETDILARWGGDEFLILTPESDINNTKLMANKLGALIKEFRFQEVGNVTSSFGVAQFRPGDDLETFIGRADHVLYRAKEGGRGRVEA